VEVLRRGLKFLPFLSSYYKTLIGNKVFDLLSTLYLHECDVLHIVSSQGPLTAQRLKAKGSILIIDERIAHVTYLTKLLKEEYKRFGCSLNSKQFFKDVRNREYKIADFIFIPSKYVYDTFIKMGVDHKKLFVIPYGVDLKTFHKGIKKDNVFRLIFVGQIGFRKGVYYLLKAYKELRLKNSELVLVGNIEESFKPILKKYQDTYKYIPHMPEKELIRYYNNSSVFILPSLIEGSALVSYEAMACGLPAIVTENCGAVIRDGKDGFIIPIRNIEALKEKILILYKNKTLRKVMGDSAREYANNFTWENYRVSIIQAYKKIIQIKGLADKL